MYGLYFAFNETTTDWVLRTFCWVVLLITAIMVWIPKFVHHLELLFVIPSSVIMIEGTFTTPYAGRTIQEYWVTVLGRDMSLLLMYPIMAQIQPKLAIFWPPIALLSYLLVAAFPWMREKADFSVGLATHTLFFVFFLIIASIYCVSLDWMTRKQYRHNQILEQRIQSLQGKQEGNSRLVEHIFPGQVHKFVMASANGESRSEARGKRFEDAVVIFGDLVQFSRYSETIETFQAVDTLNKVYALWDSLADQHGLMKIKTVGEMYMAVGNCPDEVPKADCSERAVQFCLDAIRGFKALQPTLFRRGSPEASLVSPRFGAHIGPLVAGTIGAIKLTFDIWGDTVNVASRLCTNGKPLHVQVSSSVLQRVLAHRDPSTSSTLDLPSAPLQALSDETCRVLAQSVQCVGFRHEDKDNEPARTAAKHGHVVVEPRGALHLKNRGAFHAFLVSYQRAVREEEVCSATVDKDYSVSLEDSSLPPLHFPSSRSPIADQPGEVTTPVTPFGEPTHTHTPATSHQSTKDDSLSLSYPMRTPISGGSGISASASIISSQTSYPHTEESCEGEDDDDEGDAVLEMIRSACQTAASSQLQRVPESARGPESARSLHSARDGDGSARDSTRDSSRRRRRGKASAPSSSAPSSAALPDLSPTSESFKAASSALKKFYLFRDRRLLPKYCASALPNALRFHQISCVLLAAFFLAMVLMDSFRFPYCKGAMMALHGAGLGYGVLVSLVSFLALPRLTRKGKAKGFVAQNAIPFVAFVNSLVLNGTQWAGMILVFTNPNLPIPTSLLDPNMLSYLNTEGIFFFTHCMERIWWATLLFPIHSVVFKLAYHFICLIVFNALSVWLFPTIIDGITYGSIQGFNTLGSVIAIVATERTWRKDFLNIREIAKKREVLAQENKKSKQLLRSLVPPRLLRRLLTNPSAIAERIPDCTMLFADLVSFTAWCHNQPADQIVGVLDQFFKRIDFIASRLGVDQCCTIGDCYVATANVMRPVRNHGERMVRFAQEMLSELHRFNQETGQHLQIRIGIGTGSVISAILGTQRFTYDCFGPAANGAKLMEATGLANMIHLSQQVKGKISESAFPVRKGPEVAGEQTYFLLGTHATESE
eukprot:gnl/Trimastix_PCT/2337.p1 GENE.gnl/Trimastix_PCT/2337~~gnl/Trimastix_PCT/2337.p1  ORF type:complete len:1107 (-),score=283.57 gnl/Trimastix_PCT/2337:361-3681(-)